LKQENKNKWKGYFRTVFFRLVLPSLIALGVWSYAMSKAQLSYPFAVLLSVEGTLLLAFAISFPPGPNRIKWFFHSTNYGSTPSFSYPNFYLGLLFLVVGIIMAAGFPGPPTPAEQVSIMKDNLICTIEESSNKRSTGNRISLLGLQTDTPKTLYESGVTSPMEKLWESDKTLTIQLVATGTGSVDTILIDKTTGRFSRATAGSLAGVYADAERGSCR
jgi:hypothetical protein